MSVESLTDNRHGASPDPVPMSVVRFSLEGLPPAIRKKHARQYPFKEGEHLLFLGEIVGMPGHCVVVNKKGHTLWGYHTDNFVQLTEEEL